MTVPITAFIAPGGNEVLFILLIFILLFGAKDAPRMLRTLQNGLEKLRRIAADFRHELMFSDLHRNENPSDTAPYEEPADEPSEEPDVEKTKD